MKLSDDEWVARARARVAAGQPWDDDPGAALELMVAEDQSHAEKAPAKCPACETHPPLEVVARYETLSTTPLLRCPACYGFWAAGDALTHEVRDPHDEHPSFFAAEAPNRCRQCLGWIKPDGVCSKCGWSRPVLNCPACGAAMARVLKDKVTLDSCEPCHGLWFDVGEIGRIYGLAPIEGLVDSHAADHEPAGWALMLNAAVRIAGPFI